jgi:hypothetical protein
MTVRKPQDDAIGPSEYDGSRQSEPRVPRNDDPAHPRYDEEAWRETTRTRGQGRQRRA